ncbi:MAG: hypothetical protein JW787_06415 [Sedimentisphaerales bacterium]|nr:hypothetical protein [Sedimentisphaerales bacterium]
MENKEFEKYLNNIEFNDKPDYAHRDKLEKKLQASFVGQSQPNENNKQRFIVINRALKLAAAAVFVVIALIIFNQFGSNAVVWADVVQKFQSIAFFNATIYIKEDASKEPTQIEIWRNSEQETRIRVDSQVLFAKANNIVAGYNFADKRKLSEKDYDENGLMVMKKILGTPEFSLNTILNSVSGGDLEETTPLINPNAMISEDMLVFDIQSTVSPEWMRIWTLRESKLPTRIRMWDPRDGESIDVCMSYSAEQASEFFNPAAYEKILLESDNTTSRGSQANLAYALLKDPGGRDYVPKELFEKAGGYHMPKVERIGITKYGAVWIVASKSRNTRPDGNPFFGFSKVTDNLNRKYKSTGGVHITLSDISVEIFVPDEYPFDERLPDEITLECKVENWPPDEPEEIVGTLDITEWEPNSIWPQDKFNEKETDIILSKAWEYARAKKYDECLKAIDLVRKLESGTKYDHQIDRINLAMLINQGKFGQADELAEKLLPKEKEKFITSGVNASYQPFTDYIIAIAGNGRIERATQIFKEMRTLEPDLSQYNPNARKSILSQIHDVGQNLLGYDFTNNLFNKANLTLEQVNQIAGFNVLENDETKWYVPEKYRMANDPDTITWNNHLDELAEYYKANPLELGQMEFRERPYCRQISRFEIPGLDDYKTMPVSGTLHNFASLYKYPELTGRIRIDADINNISLQHEVISRGQIDRDKKSEFVLTQFGLEIAESEDLCTVWIAEYNGQELKDFTNVRSPVMRGSTDTPGMSSYMASAGLNINSLLTELAVDQDIVIEDNTGIDKSTKLSLEVPNFRTRKGAELAEEWYKENFGITFKIEQRPMKVWVVRKKAQ